MKFTTGHALSLLTACLFAGALYSSFAWEWGSRLFVQAIAIPGIVISLLSLITESSRTFAGNKASEPYLDVATDDGSAKQLLRRRTLNIFTWIGGLLVLIWLIGFQIAVPLFTFLYLKFQARESLFLSLALAGFMLGLIIGIFDMMLNVPWPKGSIQTWIGF